MLQYPQEIKIYTFVRVHKGICACVFLCVCMCVLQLEAIDLCKRQALGEVIKMTASVTFLLSYSATLITQRGPLGNALESE